MAYSPSRRHPSNLSTRREIYSADNWQENFNQGNFCQQTPSIRSPRLNEESSYTKLLDANILEQTKIKLETVLKHNSQLLNENARLSEMINTHRIESEARIKRDEFELARANSEMEVVICEMKQQHKIQELEIIRLLDEISRLHEEKYELEMAKNNEIKAAQERGQRELTVQIRNLKKSSEDAKELLEVQVKKLKDSLELQHFESEAQKAQAKQENEKLKSAVEQLNNEMRHLNQLKEMELKGMQDNLKETLTHKKNQFDRQNKMQVSKLESKVRKLKNDVINKNIEIEQVNRKITHHSEQHVQEMQHLREGRQQLLEQIVELEKSSKENFIRQKDRLIELGELEKKNMQEIATNERECLKSQIDKLLTVCLSKTDEIKNLYNVIADLKSAMGSERQELQRMIANLRQRLKSLEEDSLEEIELLKIKMSKLHEADITGLSKYYQNQIIVLTQQIRERGDENSQNREKIHKLLQDNDQLRKKFQIELSKSKVKIQDYKVKMAAANLQFREQVTSLGTKMQLTSQTLLREAEQKKKGAQFFETEKRKYHALIESKDKQINNAYETLSQLKELTNNEIRDLKQQLIELKQTLTDRDNQLKTMRKSYEQEFQEKSKQLAEQHHDPDQGLHQENYELRNQLETAQQTLLAKEKQLQIYQKQVKTLQQEVGLRAGFIETMQLESSAAIEDEKSKMKILMSEAEVAMKDYYQVKLTSTEKDNESLRNQLLEKQQDIRQLIVKYNLLEKRLKELLEAQSKLTEFSQKIQSLGLDQNLVKNMGELFARYHRE